MKKCLGVENVCGGYRSVDILAMKLSVKKTLINQLISPSRLDRIQNQVSSGLSAHDALTIPELLENITAALFGPHFSQLSNNFWAIQSHWITNLEYLRGNFTDHIGIYSLSELHRIWKSLPKNSSAETQGIILSIQSELSQWFQFDR